MSQTLLRVRDGHGASVSFSELLFDLIYVFAVTQLSHYLLHHLTLTGAVETLLLWFAVWLAWQYTAWVTNWFNPDTRPIRILLFGIMLLGLFASSALPQAFGERGLTFALFYVAIQVGRSCVVLNLLPAGHPLKQNFRRILGWMCISAVFWILGGLAEGHNRLVLWALAVLCEYVSPMFGFRLPVLGRSDSSSEWTIEGHHLAERCQLFVIVALGETILITGSTLSEMESWSAPVLIASLVAFLGSLAMWWVYFDTSSKAGSHAISQAENPGQLGANFHYVHVVLVGAIIVCAVANELVIAHPDGHIDNVTAAVLLLGPAIYLLANALYKRLVYRRFPLSHLVGLIALAVLAPIAYLTDLLMVNGLTTLIMVAVAVWESISRAERRRPAAFTDKPENRGQCAIETSPPVALFTSAVAVASAPTAR